MVLRLARQPAERSTSAYSRAKPQKSIRPLQPLPALVHPDWVVTHPLVPPPFRADCLVLAEPPRLRSLQALVVLWLAWCFVTPARPPHKSFPRRNESLKGDCLVSSSPFGILA